MKFKITEHAWNKIMAYTELCPDEISGLGKIEMEKGVMLVTDVAIFEQRVSGAHSTITTEALAKFQTEMIKEGESMKKWTFWWHSHANMGVFFSKTDTDTIEGSTEFPYLVSLVVNKKREYKARLDVHYPAHLYVDLDMEIVWGEESQEVKSAREYLESLQEAEIKQIKELCQEDIKEKVTRNVVVHTYARKEEKGGRWPFGSAGYGYQDRRSDLEREGESDTDMMLDAYVRTEYFQHKNWILNQIKYLKKAIKKNPKDQEKALALKLRTEEYDDHILWGKSQGFEVTKISDMLPTIVDKPTSSTPPDSKMPF